MRALTEYFPQIYLTANSIIYGILVFLFILDSNTWFENLGILPRNPVGKGFSSQQPGRTGAA